MLSIPSKLKNNVPLFIILLIASVLRLYALASVPPSPSLDEVSLGYNAYLILQTGRDEYGYAVPILLRAYDDWRPALYVYFIVPFVAFFGLTTFAVRLPSVLLSIATVFLTYQLVLAFFGKTVSFKKHLVPTKNIALTASFLLAISPWHIYLSRLGHEVNVGLFITVLSIFVFIVNLREKKPYLLYVSGILFGLSFSAYQSQKVIIPLLLLSLIILFQKQLLFFRKILLLGLLFFVVFAFPAVFATFSDEGLMRFRATSAISTSPLYAESAENILKAKEQGNTIKEIYYNRRFVPIRIVASQYLSHFNPSWLFLGEERENHKVPNMGLLYFWEMPFLLIGFFFISFAKIEKRMKIFLTIWLLSSPLAAAFTTEAPHAMRSFTFLPLLQIIIAFGILGFFTSVKRKIFRILVSGLLVVVIFSGVFSFFQNYYYVFPRSQSDSFQIALFQAMRYVALNQTKFKEIVVSNEENLYQSYMFYLFVSRFNPETYQKTGGTISGGFAKQHTIGNITFRSLDWEKEKKNPQTLFVGNEADFLGQKPMLQFRFLNGEVGVVALSL